LWPVDEKRDTTTLCRNNEWKKVTVSCLRKPLLDVLELSRETKCLTLLKVGRMKLQAADSFVLSSEKRKKN
jgi:hypothetical protein